MSSYYKRGESLWVAFKDEQGKRVCRPSGYKVGDEAAVRALLVELDQKADAAAATHRNRLTGAIIAATETALRAAPGSIDMMRVTVQPKVQVQTTVPVSTPELTGPTVREYGEQWLTTRDEIETYADECSRLRNHVFPRIGHMRMREVRPRHIRDLILDLKKSNVHLRGTGQGFGTEKMAPRTVRHIYSLVRRMFSAAVIDEIIEASPVVVAKGVLPKNVDKDPAWRAARSTSEPSWCS